MKEPALDAVHDAVEMDLGRLPSDLIDLAIDGLSRHDGDAETDDTTIDDQLPDPRPVVEKAALSHSDAHPADTSDHDTVITSYWKLWRSP